jgi:DNA primase
LIYRGRTIDPVALWEQYVEFPPNMDGEDEFASKVVCPNPDHDTNKKHFQINLKYPMVHCFANCGISGGYEHALQIVTGCTRREARREILGYSRIPTPGDRKRHRAQSQRAKEKSEKSVVLPALADYAYVPEAARAYLNERGIKDRSIARFQIGYDSSERRVTIPVFDSNGTLRLVIKRAIRNKDWPKYLYTEGVDKTRYLYGFDKIDPGMIKSWGVVLVEGSIDCVILDQYGVKPVVAIMGSALSEFQAEIIARARPKCIYTMFDRDSSGIYATNSVHRLLSRIPQKVCRFPRGKNDPAELTRREAYHSVEHALPFSLFSARVKQRTKGVSVGKT